VLSQVSADMKPLYLTRKKILIISPEPYDHIPVSKHHYAMALAAQDNEVFFLNPPSDQERIMTTDVSHLKVVDYKTIRGLNKMPRLIRDFLNKRIIRRIESRCARATGAHQAGFDVIWTFDPFRFQNLSLFRNAKIRLYHAVDIHIAPLENELVSTSDVIVSVSEQIHKKYEGLGKVTARIGHGLAAHFINTARERSASPVVKAGYIGNLDNWCIDPETLLAIVSGHPGVHFYFIGPYAKDSYLGNRLSVMKNCTLVGKVPSTALPGYLFQYDLFLMCYDGSNVEVNSNHHKILEYIATGMPAVINYTDDYKDSDLVVMSRQNSELPALFAEVVNNLQTYTSPAIRQKRVAFAQANAYHNHVLTIDKILVNFQNASAAAHTE